MDDLMLPVVSLRRLRSGSALQQHRPTWATDEELNELKKAVRPLLAPTGFTETAAILDGVSKLIAMPKEEQAMLVYVETLKDFPRDVLEKSCKSVVQSHLSQRPPNVAVFRRVCQEDVDYQRRLGWLRSIDALFAKPMPSERPKVTPGERARILEGFERLRANG